MAVNEGSLGIFFLIIRIMPQSLLFAPNIALTMYLQYFILISKLMALIHTFPLLEMENAEEDSRGLRSRE